MSTAGKGGELRDPRRNTGPGLMQEVKEEKSGEAGEESGREADRGLAGAAEGTVSSFHQRKKQKSSPSSHPLMLPRTGLQHLKPRGSGIPRNRAPWCQGA